MDESYTLLVSKANESSAAGGATIQVLTHYNLWILFYIFYGDFWIWNLVVIFLLFFFVCFTLYFGIEIACYTLLNLSIINGMRECTFRNHLYQNVEWLNALLGFTLTLKFIVQLTFTKMYSNMNHFTFNSLLIKISYTKSIFTTAESNTYSFVESKAYSLLFFSKCKKLNWMWFSFLR